MSIQAELAEQLNTFADAARLFIQMLRRLPKRKSWRWNDINRYVVQMGLGSLPIIVVSTAVAGTVVTHEIAWHMNSALHSVTMIPGFSGQFVFRELGVAIPAMLLVAKVGAAITAEVGTMKITEQIDALKLLRIDPISYLVFPRFVASVFSSACLTLIAVSITMACSLAVAIHSYGFSLLEFINGFRHFVGINDFFCALAKGVVYGSVIPVVSCAYGFRCKGGAQGVGTSTTNSVVTSTIAIISLDFLLTYLFTLIL